MAAPNVWTQMNYVPPRGQCNYKQSVLSPKCPCLRFMLHPLKSTSSYECDGCNHHASFHSMENKTEDEVRKRWEQEAKDKADQEEEVAQRSKKRPRLLQITGAKKHPGAFDDTGLDELLDLTMANSNPVTKARAPAKKPRRAAAARAKGKVTEIVEEEDDDVIEVD